jgi:hypothetical protein
MREDGRVPLAPGASSVPRVQVGNCDGMPGGFLPGSVSHPSLAAGGFTHRVRFGPLAVSVSNKAGDPDKGCPLVPWPKSGNVGDSSCGGLLSTSAGLYLPCT